MDVETSDTIDTDTAVSDEWIQTELNRILLESDLNSITYQTIRIQLEQSSASSLTNRKALIKKVIEEFIQQRVDADNGAADDHIEKNGSAKKKNGFSAPVQLSNELSEFLGGIVQLPRTEVVKQIWSYVREHDLQNPKDRREILCDAKLEKLFKRKKFTMFQMNKHLSHMMKSINELQEGEDSEHEEMIEESEHSPDEEKVDEQPLKEKRISTKIVNKKIKTNQNSKKNIKKKEVKEKSDESQDDDEGIDDADEDGHDSRHTTLKRNGFSAPVQLSNELSEFLGGAVHVPRTEVVKQIWSYVKEHDLQNPKDRREILCDAKLEKLFKRKKFTMFQMNKHLSHMMKSLQDLNDDHGIQEKKVKKEMTKEVKDETLSRKRKKS